MQTPRIAALFVPLFPLAARLRSEPELLGGAVAVCEGNGSAAQVAAASRIARHSGVRAGMTLAQARSVLPDLVARGRDPLCERSAHEALLETAWHLSPRVEDAADDLVLADVTGTERLYDDERQLGLEAMARAEGLGLLVRLGIASTKLAARVAASRPDSPVVVAEGDEARFLAPLPLSCLGLDRRLAATVRRWGVTRVGDLARLPADRVASRLGKAGAAAHQTARGIDPHPLVPRHAPPTLNEGLELEWPVVTVEPLLYALRQCLDRLHQRLARQGLACTLLELELELEPEGSDRRAVRLPSPTRDVDALIGLVRLELEARPTRAPVAAFACALHPDEPRRGQLTLFGPEEVHPDRLATAMATLAGRIGPDRLGAPVSIDGHLPERFATAVCEPPPAPKLRREPRQGRGLLTVRVLRPPVGLEVITDSNGDPTTRLVSMTSATGAALRIQGLVRVAAGPWRIEHGWWDEDPTERDYWDVELSGGTLYRVFRNGEGEWFADGVYD